MHREFVRIKSTKPEYVKTHCNDRNKSFDFACRRWILYNQTNWRHNNFFRKFNLNIFQKLHWLTFIYTFSTICEWPFLAEFPIKSCQLFQASRYSDSSSYSFCARWQRQGDVGYERNPKHYDYQLGKVLTLVKVQILLCYRRHKRKKETRKSVHILLCRHNW